MHTCSRKTFLHQCLALGALGYLSPLVNHASHPGGPAATLDWPTVVAANTAEVAELLKNPPAAQGVVRRRLGYDLANLAAAYATPESPYAGQAALLPPMQAIVALLLSNQHPDGTLDIGNLASPPDTAFILEPLCSGATILGRLSTPALAPLKADLKRFIERAGEGLRTGGVHTPNHRWVVSAALARVNALYPRPGYVARIREWLDEVIYQDRDGAYLERSMTYSAVIDHSLLTLARLLPMPSLLTYVRKNLDLVYYLSEPNGELVSTGSRRQDQYRDVTGLASKAPATPRPQDLYSSQNLLAFYHVFLYLAIRDTNPTYAAIARFAEGIDGFDTLIGRDLLSVCAEEPLFRQPTPAPKAPPVRFTKLFAQTNLVRIRRDARTTTLFGGADFPIIIASGRSNSPNFLGYRNGAAVLHYLRLSTDFFSTGYFHSQGIRAVGSGYQLEQVIEAPYYQPLPKAYRRADGDSRLSPSTDGRFWNKMDFSHRPVSNLKRMVVQVMVQPLDTGNQLTIRVDGAKGVRVTLEFCFGRGGTVSGLRPVEGQADTYWLEADGGTYQAGSDTIRLGPGVVQHAKISGLEGEAYSSHFGSLRTEGIHVYSTGLTPFAHTLTIG